jgi:4-amino-4-deoxy-L-arabinose transferase-like glycosyltransferase
VSYAAYLPGYWAMGWTGKWDDLPAAHFTSILWDVLALAASYLVGRRLGGIRLGVTLAFAWAAFPFTQYVSNSNTNDAIMPALLLLGFWLAARDGARGALLGLAGWTKFAAFIVAPLWLTYPEWRRPRLLRAIAGLAVATVASLSVLFFEPDVLHQFRVFWDRTVWIQVTRHSPFGLWDWGQYHAKGIPDLHVVQKVLQVLLVVGALAAAFLPRRKSPFQLAALTAALLIGFEVVLTHWFYLYIPWFFPFAAFVALAPRERPAPAEPEPPQEEPRALVAAG